MTERKAVYTLDEVAELLSVSRPMVSRLIRSGRLRVARLGQRTARVTDEALSAFLEAQESTGPAPYPYRHQPGKRETGD